MTKIVVELVMFTLYEGQLWVAALSEGDRLQLPREEWKGEGTLQHHASGLAYIPHALRHTGVTWGMQAGMDLWDASGYFGMSTQTLLSVYGHHHPDHLRSAASKMARRH